MRTISGRIRAEWIIAATLLLTILALWLPFGFNVGFVGDDWFFYLNAQHGIAWAAPDRPFLPLAYVLGYLLAPGYFAGFNLMLAALLFGRSALCYLILRQLGAGKAVGFAFALLVAVFPADTGLFYLGALNVYFAWVAYLLALYLLIRYWQRLQLSTLALMWCALIINVATYEAAYPLILVSPLLLLFLQRRSRRQWIALLFRWYLFPALNVLRLAVQVLLSPETFHYQSGLLPSAASFGTVITSLLGIYQRHFASAWVGAGMTSTDWLIAFAIAAAAGFVCWRLAQPAEPTHSRRWYGGLIGVGLIIVALGVLVYLPTSLRDVTVRTFFASSIGAALAWVGLIRLLTRRALPFALLLGVLVALGCAQLLVEHRLYADETSAQQTAVLQVIASVPALPPHSALLIMDETPDHALETLSWSHWQVQNAFLVAYNDSTLSVALCSPSRTTPTPVTDYCAFLPDAVEARLSPAIVWSRPYDHTVLVRYTAQHEFIVQQDLSPYAENSAYQPQALINAGDPQQVVARRLFTGAKTP